MKIGTKSVLFGAHCFFIHPWFVALGWWKLYGFPWDPRMWVAFAVHDLGYWGKPNMDGEEGEYHPMLGAKIMRWLFDSDASWFSRTAGGVLNLIFGRHDLSWFYFSYYHSRFLAKRYEVPFSPLCVADKLAITLTWRWLYLFCVNLTGEVEEYMKLSDRMCDFPTPESQRAWYDAMTKYVRSWVEEHKDMRRDTWTRDKTERSVDGVWK